MKYLLILCSLLLLQSADAQFSSNIYWTEQTNLSPSEVIYFNPQKLLSWRDFRGSAPASSPASAITASGFGYKADVRNSGTKGQINVGVYCFFNKNNSWVKAGKTTDYILSHEQNHFNISFIGACYFIEKLKAENLTNNNYNNVLARLYKESCDYMNKMQQDYDGQTKNGQLKDMQANWERFVNQKLSSLTK